MLLILVKHVKMDFGIIKVKLVVKMENLFIIQKHLVMIVCIIQILIVIVN